MPTRPMLRRRHLRHLTGAHFNSTDEVTLVAAQSAAGAPDDNWHGEQIKLTLDAGAGVEVSPAVYTINVHDINVAPVAKFDAPSFTLTEGSERAVALDIVEGRLGAGIPGAISNRTGWRVITVRVHNSSMVGLTCTAGKAVSIAPTIRVNGKATAAPWPRPVCCAPSRLPISLPWPNRTATDCDHGKLDDRGL